MSEREITRQEVEPLLRNSPLRARIDYLLDNQGLGKKPLTKLTGYGNIYPNCFGTALFVLGAERDILGKFRGENGSSGEVIVQSKRNGDFMVFPKGFAGPGSLQDSNMKSFFRDMCQKVDLLQAGDITYEEGYCSEGDSDYHHSMVFLGNLDERKYFFQQEGLRGRFCFKSVAQFEAVAISPEELGKYSLLELATHFWRYGEMSVREFYRFKSGVESNGG